MRAFFYSGPRNYYAREETVSNSPHQNRILVDLIRKKKWYYLGSVLAVSIASYFLFLVPTIGKLVIDCVIRDTCSDDAGLVSLLIVRLGGGIDSVSVQLWIAGAVIVIVTALAGLFMYLKDYLAAAACESTIRSLRDELFGHLHRLSDTYLNKADSGDIVQRCTSDIDTLRDFLTVQVMNIGRTSLLMAIVIPLMFMQSAAMSVLALCLVPIVLYFAWIFFERIKILFKQVDEAEGRMTTIIQENLTGIRVVRAFARQEYECDKFDAGNTHYSDLHYTLICMLANFWSLSDLLCMAQNGLVLIGGGWFAAQGKISVGTYFAFIGYTNMLIWPIRQLGQQLSEAGKATVAIGRIQEILDAPGETEPANGQNLPTHFSGRVRFKNVSFGYDENKPVVKGVSFLIDPGETIAIVGPTGSGKSTLIQLLMRLQEYQMGSIRLDGMELNKINRESVRQHVGSLLQEPFLFSRSLRENIKFGRLGANDEQMICAARDAAIHHTIEGFQHGYNTVIGERGVRLSGGQKQRVTLSRTLLKEAQVLVLDDTLSAVDTNTERDIIRTLHRKRGRQTVLIITHRISVCQNADRIFVMEDGRLTAQGPHAALKNISGFYQKLWRIQTGQKEDFTADFPMSA